jgi:hypothetical protein
MQLDPARRSNHLLTRIGRHLLKRLEMPLSSYEQRIINNMPSLVKEIRPGDVLLVEGRFEYKSIWANQ